MIKYGPYQGIIKIPSKNEKIKHYEELYESKHSEEIAIYQILKQNETIQTKEIPCRQKTALDIDTYLTKNWQTNENIDLFLENLSSHQTRIQYAFGEEESPDSKRNHSNLMEEIREKYPSFEKHIDFSTDKDTTQKESLFADNPKIVSALKELSRNPESAGDPFISLDQYRWIATHSDALTFSNAVKTIMQKKEITAKELCSRIWIDRRLYSKLNRDPNYQPSKQTAMVLCIGLQLNFKEAEKLINTAGYSFSSAVLYDVLIRYCLENKIYDLYTINGILSRYKLKCIGTISE